MPRKVVEVAKDALGHAVSEIRAPTAQDGVDPFQEVGEGAMCFSRRQRPHFVDDSLYGFLRRVSVDVSPGCTSFAPSLNAKAQEVKP